MKNNLFRKEAVASAQRTFDTRQNLYSLPLNMKLIAFLLALCFALFVVWMFFGNLTQTLKADGIIYSKNGQRHMYAPSGGIVSDVLGLEFLADAALVVLLAVEETFLVSVKAAVVAAVVVSVDVVVETAVVSAAIISSTCTSKSGANLKTSGMPLSLTFETDNL